MLQKANIEVDTRKLRQEAIIENKTCISKLTSASNKISGIKMPDDFTYKTKIEVLPSRLEEIKEKISGINKYIDQKASEFENLQSSKSFGTQNYPNQNTSPLNWSPSYQGGGVPNMGYGGYGSGMIDLKTFLENMKKTGAKTVDFFKAFFPTKVYANETYEGRTYNVEQVVDLEEYVHENGCDALQGGCYDGKNIVLTMNKKCDELGPNGEKNSSGGYVIWLDPDTKEVVKKMEIEEAGGHMEGITYDRKQDFILLRNYYKDGTLLRIDNSTKTRMSNVGIPKYFRQHAYSKDTDELVGFEMDVRLLTYMKYDPKKDRYDTSRQVNLNANEDSFMNIQGISSYKDVVYLSDSEAFKDEKNFRVWGYDSKGNKKEEHKMGEGYKNNVTEVENTFTDDNGDTYLVMPFEVVKVKD